METGLLLKLETIMLRLYERSTWIKSNLNLNRELVIMLRDLDRGIYDKGLRMFQIELSKARAGEPAAANVLGNLVYVRHSSPKTGTTFETTVRQRPPLLIRSIHSDYAWHNLICCMLPALNNPKAPYRGTALIDSSWNAGLEGVETAWTNYSTDPEKL